ncbi:MAG: DUF952 domain-containing protein [Alteromonadaceae bacterium]
MGLKIPNKSVLRSDNYPELLLGKIYSFTESDNEMFTENSPLWLTSSDWEALAEISIISQSVENKNLKGTFRIDYIYQGSEQQTLTNTFIRMYAGLNDDNIYLLSSQAEYQQALNEGVLTRDSLISEGFIHATPRSQLTRLANKYYKNKVHPLILVVDKTLILPEVKWEPATGGLYPHIYGPLNMNAVTAIEEISLNEEGIFQL